MESGAKITKGRSKCPNCGKVLGIWELIPVCSYLIQKGRCKGCGWAIPLQYLALEIVTAAIFVFAVSMNSVASGGDGCLDFFATCVSAKALRDIVFASALIVVFVYDLKHKLIPDAAVIPGFLFAFVWNLAAGTSVKFILSGVLLGGGFFLLQYLLSKGKWIGEGDIRLGAMMGAILGFPGIVLALFLSYIIGAVISLGLVALKLADMKSAVPFGTFLALGTAISLFYGPQIISWYFLRIGL